MSRSLAIEPKSQSTQPASAAAESETIQERIRVRAYELYEARGYVDGHHEDDWFQAENELLGHDTIVQAA